MKIPIESRFHPNRPLQRPHSSLKGGAAIFARIRDSAEQPSSLAVRGGKKGSHKKSNAMLRCECQHAKSIHSRMYANKKLGTSCNFPGCRCKAYKPE